MLKIICPVCSREFAEHQYKQSMFCPDCGKYLQHIRISNQVDEPDTLAQKTLKPEQAQVLKLWPVYIKSSIVISPRNKFPSVEAWIRKRKQVYSIYKNKFSYDNLDNIEQIRRDFYSWLIFRNNLSWSSLQYTASNALDNPERLANLLLKLQDEDKTIASRVRYALQGSGRINGLGHGIITALLHTFNNERYGVWNNKTIGTLKKLHMPMVPNEDPGETYKQVNKKLNALAEELRTDLTTLDGFMWYVNKNYDFLDYENQQIDSKSNN